MRYPVGGADVAIAAIESNPRPRPPLSLSRREIFVWVAALLFSNHLGSSVRESYSAGSLKIISELFAIGIFQYVAWYVIFRLLWASDGAPPARWRDLLAAAAFCIPVFIPSSKIIWVVATGLAGYLLLLNNDDRRLHAAAIVIAALSVQELWGRLFFGLLVPYLLRVETAAVGTALAATTAGTVWKDNVISGPTGFGIVIFGPCSAFHNLSLALLCWVSLTKSRCQHWDRRTLANGAIIAATMISLNVARLYLMALNIDSYHFWHDGAGAEIFAVGASFAILSLGLFAARPTRRMA